MTAKEIRIGVVGAGIGGLTFALALRQRGLAADVYEQASELREIGAAVALTANGTRELERLGCLDAIAALSTEPSEIIWRRWRDDHRIASFPIAKSGVYRARFGAAYFGIHRLDLQRVLGAAHGPDRLHLDHRLIAFSEKNNVIKLNFANGKNAEVDVLIGADGQHSPVRKYIVGEERVSYSRTNGFRGIVPVRNLPSLPDPQAVQFWMGPNAHLLHFALGPSGSDVNFLAVVEGPASWTHENWVAPITHDVALAAFEGWHPAIVEMISAVRTTFAGGCSRSGHYRLGGAAAPRCSATPHTACCRITARAPTFQLAVMILTGLLFGLANGMLIVGFSVSPFIVTLGMLSVAKGLSLLLTGGLPLYSVPDALADNLGFGAVFGVPLSSIVAFAAMLVGAFILRNSIFGRYVYERSRGAQFRCSRRPRPAARPQVLRPSS
jgi:2-polyprenyl-6-methoxyphenol hydroxylase-like FAD-dependent oxidoreductase